MALNAKTLCQDLFQLMTCKISQEQFCKKYEKYPIKAENNGGFDMIIVGDDEESEDYKVISID